MTAIVQPCRSGPCPALRAEKAKLQRFKADADAAKAVYAPLQSRVPPADFRNATDADLAEMGLTREFIDNPVDPKTGEKSQFRAAVFVNDNTGERLVAFKGTTPTSGEDWTTNAQQGLGQETFYYTRAQQIAVKASASPHGGNLRFTGHSLGGGLASAASRASGKNATTFNAAGLHPSTVKNQKPGGNIDAVHVRGEALTGVQSLGLPRTPNTTKWPLDPPQGYGKWLVAGGAFFGIKGAAAAAAARSVGLHMMGSVDRSLAEREVEVDAEMKQHRC